MLVLKHVTKKFAGASVLSDVSFRVDPKEFVCLTGPSGAGKSTLIHLLVGAEQATSGTVEVDGVDLRRVPPGAMQLYRRRVGVVFQDCKLIDNRTVEENVAFPLEVCGYSSALIRKRVPLLLDYMGLLPKRRTLPRELSGGEKARTAIARAVVHKPMILLADEPTGNLDPAQSRLILDLLKEINDAGTTVILATHDAGLVDRVQARVIRLENGRIVRDGTGGYEADETKAAAPAAAQERTEAPPAEPQLVFKKAAAEAAKKVRITSIGSV
ncbi:MAG: ATP-binding cassette domain-containing protein [Candidatus Peribacteraceae bacterium]|nr:ATP-binding cassette domain-containing protein [Candidatus Peribacteraceae bacterium]